MTDKNAQELRNLAGIEYISNEYSTEQPLHCGARKLSDLQWRRAAKFEHLEYPLEMDYNDRTFQIELHIIPSEDQSTFIETLAALLNRNISPLRDTWQGFPLDNSYLYSLLVELPTSHYARTICKYIPHLMRHINGKGYVGCTSSA